MFVRVQRPINLKKPVQRPVFFRWLPASLLWIGSPQLQLILARPPQKPTQRSHNNNEKQSQKNPPKNPAEGKTRPHRKQMITPEPARPNRSTNRCRRKHAQQP